MNIRTPMFRPLSQTPNLTGHLVEAIEARIEAGELAPGQRLPTEQAIVDAAGVSRTVVREALASLRAKGLITTRQGQGRGAFVAVRPKTAPSFSLGAGAGDAEPITRMLHVLELRIGIEVEAAGLAAERRTEDDLAALEASVEAFEAGFDEPDGGAEHDLAFHRAMLLSTGNPHFAEVFGVIGTLIVPRQRLWLGMVPASERLGGLKRLLAEHRAILSAIRAGDAPAARRAARSHLTKARERYKALGALLLQGGEG